MSVMLALFLLMGLMLFAGASGRSGRSGRSGGSASDGIEYPTGADFEGDGGVNDDKPSGEVDVDEGDGANEDFDGLDNEDSGRSRGRSRNARRDPDEEDQEGEGRETDDSRDAEDEGEGEGELDGDGEEGQRESDDDDDASIDVTDEEWNVRQRCIENEIPQSEVKRLLHGVPPKLRVKTLNRMIDQIEQAKANALAPYQGRFAGGPGTQGAPNQGGQGGNQGAAGNGQGAGGNASGGGNADDELKLTFEDGKFDADLVGQFNKVANHYNGVIKAVRNDNLQLRGLVAQLQFESATRLIDDFVGGLGPNWEGTFGKGPTSKLPRTGAFYSARMKLGRASAKMDELVRREGQESLTEDEIMFRALAGAFPKQHRAAERRRLQTRSRERIRGASGNRPQSIREPMSTGRAAAMDFVREALRGV